MLLMKKRKSDKEGKGTVWVARFKAKDELYRKLGTKDGENY